MVDVLDQLAGYDRDNYDESTRALRALDGDTLTTAEALACVFDELASRFGADSEYDRHRRILDEWLAKQTGSPSDLVRMLESATLIGDSDTADPVAEAQHALRSAYSVIARTYLLLRLKRDFLFGLTDLLRLRLVAAVGYLRLQSETIAIISLIVASPKTAQDWLDVARPDSGRSFYKKYHQRIVESIRALNLYDYYEQGSSMALHSRVFGLAPGLIVGQKDSEPGAISLSYQEIDDPVDLLLWFCVYIRAHERMLRVLPAALPELSANIEFSGVAQRVQGLWDRLRPVYLRKRKQRIPDDLSRLGPGAA